MAENVKNMALNIVVDDGSRRVPIVNTSGEEIGFFTFHPTDVGIVKRYNELVDKFDGIVEPLSVLEGVEDVDLSDSRYAEAIDEASKRLYDAVNELFGGDNAAEAFFGTMNPFSPVDGAFYCSNVLSAVGAYIGSAFETETAKFTAAAKKYAKKATRK